MKKIIMLTILLAALSAGCRRDDSTGTGTGSEGDLTVAFNIPEIKAATRADYVGLEAGMVQSMWVMVFNENGNYLSRHLGEQTGNDISRYTFRNVPASEEARTLHFVANFDWTGFPDRDLSGISENEVVRGMNVADGTVAYWQRVELPGGIDGGPGTTWSIPGGTVHLLRNVAEVTVINSTMDGDHEMSLTDVEFAVGDHFDKGSVAPFNTVTGNFGTGDTDVDNPAADFITEALDGATVDITESDFVSAQNGDTPSEAVEIYERRNSTATKQTFVIVKGYFQDGSESENTTVPSYYKIDIVDAEATVLLDLRRNFRYKIDLQNVAHAGYSTLEEAVQNAAVNNINAAVTVSEYTAISDGSNVLRVENTHFVYVKPGQPFEIRYSYIAYIDATTSATDNRNISITLDQNDGSPVVAEGTFGWDITSSPWTSGRAGAIIRGTTADLPENFDIYRAKINVSKGVLSRVIQLQLRRAMDFFDVSTTPEDGTVPNRIGQRVSVSFKMPVDISPNLFPIPIYITTKRFSPDVSRNQLSVDVNSVNSEYEYRYVYYAEYLVDADNQPLPHTIYFVSNSPNTNETVTLSADMFNDAYAPFGNVIHDFINPRFRNSANTQDVKPRNTATGVDMRLYFSMPDDAAYPVTVTFVAPWLTYRAQGGRTQGLTVTSSGNNANTVMTMNIASAGEYYFTVRNSSTAGDNEQTPKYLQAPFFNSSADLNAQ